MNKRQGFFPIDKKINCDYSNKKKIYLRKNEHKNKSTQKKESIID